MVWGGLHTLDDGKSAMINDDIALKLIVIGGILSSSNGQIVKFVSSVFR